MIKKALVAVIAAGALSVPLAGVAWADPPSESSDPPGQSDTGPGVPRVVGAFLDSANANPNGPGNPVPPGQEFNVAKGLFGGPGVSTPEAIGDFVNAFYNSNGVPTTFGPNPPGIATKTFTPGCTHGRTASDPALGGTSICNNK
jgi:hypothetical protein